jgi:hypothetical protein
LVGRVPDLVEEQLQAAATIDDHLSERALAWAVEDRDNPTATWRFSLQPKDGGTLLTQWLQMGPARSGLSFAIDRMPEKEQKIVFVRMREFEQNMGITLKHIKQLAEG